MRNHNFESRGGILELATCLGLLCLKPGKFALQR
jgi:hypothetical protein